MNMLSLLSGPASSNATPANPPPSANGTGEFDALVNARACTSDTTDAASPTPSAATMAMLSTLDRSATMLPQSTAAKVSTADTDGDTPTPSVGEQEPMPALQAAMLMAMLTAANKALPTIAPALPGAPSDTGTVTPSASSAPKAPPPTLPTAAVPAAALFNALAAELRSVVNVKADPGGKAADAAQKPASETVDGIPVVPSASTMIRDLASMIASHVDPLTPSDIAIVDRHLDLARGDAWLNDLASDIAATAANGGRLKFGLAPESLGRLDVEIRQGQAGVSVHMTTRTDTARDVLTAAQSRIVDEIRAQGVRVAGTEVSTDASGFGGDRAGSTSRQPTGLQIEAALSLPDTAPPQTSEPAATGRYA